MGSDSFGLDYAPVGDIGVISTPGDLSSDLPTVVMRAFEPALSQQAFDHAFLDLYANATEWDTMPPYPPSNDTVTIQGVGARVTLPLLVEAMARQLEHNSELWMTLREVVGELPEDAKEPATKRMAIELRMPFDLVETAVKLGRSPADDFKKQILSSRPDVQRAVIAALGYAQT